MGGGGLIICENIEKINCMDMLKFHNLIRKFPSFYIFDRRVCCISEAIFYFHQFYKISHELGVG